MTNDQIPITKEFPLTQVPKYPKGGSWSLGLWAFGSLGVWSESFRFTFWPERFQQSAQRIIKLVHDSFLERDDGVVRDRDVFGTNFRATLGDVAEADAVSFFQFFRSILSIERMHLQRGDINQVARANELVVLVMFAQNVAHILAQETLDALAKFFHAVDVFLR